MNWDQKIDQHLRAKSQGELADLVWTLVKRFPEVYDEFRERIARQEGDIDRLLTEARREIRRATSAPGRWDDWGRGGYDADYGRIEERFERLLDRGYADEVVSLGRELIQEGLEQVGESDDEGELAAELAG